ncbi:MAG: VCBS repeat-containing protein [Alphaproteobacteria bacterium]|nr:VCBS repeat-containing protein [Alphaproteobacteria bacterium]
MNAARLAPRYIAIFATLVMAAQPLRAQTRLPDTEVTRWIGYSAWLIDPTERYGHGVLGDAIEAGGFAVTTPKGQTLIYRLPQEAVFEDRRVRLADIDGDGVPEAVVIKAYLRRGAAVAVYGIRGPVLEQIAEGPTIGIPNRWLNIIGIADVNGDGRNDIVYVQTPHLAGIVRVLNTGLGRLREAGSLEGYTNHIIGSRELDMAVIGDFVRNGTADIAVPTRDRRSLALLGFRNGKLVEVARKPLPARANGKVTARGETLIVDIEGRKSVRITFAR